MKTTMTMMIAAAAALALTACSKDVSFDTLENARKQAKENAEFNARAWRSQLPAMAELSLISRGDSTQAPACPQGDGWATIDVVDQKTAAVRVKLKCSTVSDSVGCRADADFKASPFANEDGRCQSTDKVPHPLPKIAK
jgi:PBP1b-binding outer membrane lipoprotein LpoB